MHLKLIKDSTATTAAATADTTGMLMFNQAKALCLHLVISFSSSSWQNNVHTNIWILFTMANI